MLFRRFIAGLRKGRHSARIILAIIVAAILIPALLFGGWFAQRWATSERDRIEQDLLQKTREIASDANRDVQSAMTMLTALASSPWLRSGDFEKFHRQASEVTRKLDMQIVLLDPRINRQIINTAVPWGAPLPQGARPQVVEASQRALKTGKPVVSSIFVGPLIGRPTISVGVAATDDAGATYYLAVGLPTDRFSALLDEIAIGPGRLAAILDRDNTFITRSQNHAEFTGSRIRGEPAPPGLRQGFVKTNNRDGTPFYWFFHRSELTDWVIAVGVAASELDAPTQLATVHYGIASSLLFIVVVGLTYGFGARLLRSFGTLGIDRQPTRAEFRILFESAPNGVLLADQDGTILLANAWTERTFGYSRDELIGRSVEILMPERFRDRHKKLRQKFAAAPTARPMSADRDLFGLRKDGSEFPIEIGLNPINTAQGNMVMATVVDISARKQAAEQLSAAAQALRASEEQRRLAVEAAELGPWTWDFVKHEMWWSDRLRQILGVPATTFANEHNWYDRVHPSDRQLVHNNRRRRFAGQQSYDFEYRIIRQDDLSVRWVSSKGSTTFDASGKPIWGLGIIQDITARKTAEQVRDDLRRRLMQAQEQERLRLAHTLHDETGQNLAAILMQLKHVEDMTNNSGQASLRQLRSQLEQMGSALHRVAWELRPASIDELGLESVLNDYISDWDRQFRIDADFYCRDARLDKLTDDVRTIIYRIVQEGLTNIAKHATGASTVSVVIDRVDTTLRLTIEDNGCGFDPNSSASDGRDGIGGLGLAGMRERLALVGGELEIETSPQAGTTLFVRIPLVEQDRMIA